MAGRELRTAREAEGDEPFPHPDGADLPPSLGRGSIVWDHALERGRPGPKGRPRSGESTSTREGRAVGNLRQIKELAISSIAASLLAAEGDAGLTVDESPVLSFPG
jgi:hypothetical protein